LYSFLGRNIEIVMKSKCQTMNLITSFPESFSGEEDILVETKKCHNHHADFHNFITSKQPEDFLDQENSINYSRYIDYGWKDPFFREKLSGGNLEHEKYKSWSLSVIIKRMGLILSQEPTVDILVMPDYDIYLECYNKASSSPEIAVLQQSINNQYGTAWNIVEKLNPFQISSSEQSCFAAHSVVTENFAKLSEKVTKRVPVMPGEIPATITLLGLDGLEKFGDGTLTTQLNVDGLIAIGRKDKIQEKSKLAMIITGKGHDNIQGFKNLSNIFIINSGLKILQGGNHDDQFVLVDGFEETSGFISGGFGTNTLVLTDYINHKPMNIRKLNRNSFTVTLDNKSLVVFDVQKIVGRINSTDLVEPSCNLVQLNLNGGSQFGWDKVSIPEICTFNMSIYLDQYSVVNHKKSSGIFKYRILTGPVEIKLNDETSTTITSEHIIHINYPIDNFRFKFEYNSANCIVKYGYNLTLMTKTNIDVKFLDLKLASKDTILDFSNGFRLYFLENTMTMYYKNNLTDDFERNFVHHQIFDIEENSVTFEVQHEASMRKLNATVIIMNQNVRLEDKNKAEVYPVLLSQNDCLKHIYISPNFEFESKKFIDFSCIGTDIVKMTSFTLEGQSNLKITVQQSALCSTSIIVTDGMSFSEAIKILHKKHEYQLKLWGSKVIITKDKNKISNVDVLILAPKETDRDTTFEITLEREIIDQKLMLLWNNKDQAHFYLCNDLDTKCTKPFVVLKLGYVGNEELYSSIRFDLI